MPKYYTRGLHKWKIKDQNIDSLTTKYSKCKRLYWQTFPGCHFKFPFKLNTCTITYSFTIMCLTQQWCLLWITSIRRKTYQITATMPACSLKLDRKHSKLQRSTLQLDNLQRTDFFGKQDCFEKQSQGNNTGCSHTSGNSDANHGLNIVSYHDSNITSPVKR